MLLLLEKWETKLNNTVMNSELEIEGYDLVRLDWFQRRGGVKSLE